MDLLSLLRKYCVPKLYDELKCAICGATWPDTDPPAPTECPNHHEGKYAIMTGRKIPAPKYIVENQFLLKAGPGYPGNIKEFETGLPHKVSEVMCVKCRRRWIAARPEKTLLKDLECPKCRKGFVIETGEGPEEA
jgi:Zn finger protein HypA/HybF involved in hydrogenase expression